MNRSAVADAFDQLVEQLNDSPLDPTVQLMVWYSSNDGYWKWGYVPNGF